MSDSILDVLKKGLIEAAGVYGAKVVSTSAVLAAVSSSNASGRKILVITPTDGDIYYGFTNAVTTSTGTPLYQRSTNNFAINDTTSIYLIAASSINVRIIEI